MYKPILKYVAILCGFLALVGCEAGDYSYIDYQKTAQEPTMLEKARTTARTKYHQPMPSLASLNLSEDKVRLGNMLYHDTRLSGNGKLSCASCHVLAIGGDDNQPVSTGINRQKGSINAPTTLNSGFNFKQFWDGRAESLRKQAEGPVENPIEMGAKWPNVIASLQAVETYQKLFDAIYPTQGINQYTVTDAIAEFERSLITPAPIDEYLRGDDNALTAEQQEGYRLFQSYGCVACHQGVNFGGNMMQKFGALKAYFDEKNEKTVDLGLFNQTQRPTDRNVFKVPSLRNVEHTAPYFHNGLAQTLDEAINIMGLNQLGREIPPNERTKIAAFLKSLSGEMKTTPIDPPKQ